MLLLSSTNSAVAVVRVCWRSLDEGVVLGVGEEKVRTSVEQPGGECSCVLGLPDSLNWC